VTERAFVSRSNAALSQTALVELLAELIVAVRRPHPVRVAVDGPDAAGKTTLADAVGAAVERRGRRVIRASIDGFHRPRAERYRQGAASPRGYYEDSFDYDALRASLLDPLGVGGSRKYRRGTFDFRTDQSRDVGVEIASDDAVLIFDGVFLLRPELTGRAGSSLRTTTSAMLSGCAERTAADRNAAR
jgi:uridine kinase